MIKNQIRMINNRKFEEAIHSSFSRPMTLKEKIHHKWNCFIGTEKTEVDANNNRYYTVTELGKKRAFAKETKMAKEAGKAEAKAKATAVSTPVVVRVRRGLRLSILIPIALLALRHFVPAIEEDIPAVYQFLDTVVVPIIEWVYKIGCKCVNELMSMPWFKSIIDALANLAN